MGFFGKSVDAAGMGALSLENAQIWDLLVLVLLWSFAVTLGFFPWHGVWKHSKDLGFQEKIPSHPLPSGISPWE